MSELAGSAGHAAVLSGAGRFAPVPPPRLRGWLHAGMLPLSIAAGITLIALAPTSTPRVAASVYSVTCWALFGISGAYHRGHWSPPAARRWMRADHATIYLFIAGSYTPLLLLGLSGPRRWWAVGAVWAAALAGAVFRILLPSGPRWLAVALYMLLPLGPAFLLPNFGHALGVAVLVLVLAAGALYLAGGVIYGLRRPNPSPTWFGFHEVFHSCTVVAYVLQYISVSIAIYTR